MAKKSKISYQPKPRTVFVSLAIACALLVALYACVQYALPAQNQVGSDRNYGYTYSGARSSSVDFSLASADENAILLFGSSELSTSVDTVSEVPASVLGLRNYGVQLNYVGEANDQSLWQAIAAGAYGQKVKNKKVAIIVSPTWFVDGGLDNETFKLKFSYSLYQAFCNNPSISDESRAYVARRLSEQGIDDATINAGLQTYPHDVINNAVLLTMDELKLRNELISVRDLGIDSSNISSQTPPFKAWRSHALEEAAQKSTNNNWGYDDDFYATDIEGRLDLLANTQAAETYTDTPEYDDYAFFLQVCKELGLEPLVIISPVSGPFYDHVGTSVETRAKCYERIRTIANQYGAKIADFSDREYEKYFLHDIVHFGWTGWVDVEEALVDFAKN